MNPEVYTHLLEDDGRTPNNPELPLLVYSRALPASNDLPSECELSEGSDEIPYHKTPQNTDRIACTIVNVVICRTFVRSMPLANNARTCSTIARYRKYQPPTDRAGIRCFAGLSLR